MEGSLRESAGDDFKRAFKRWEGKGNLDVVKPRT